MKSVTIPIGIYIFDREIEASIEATIERDERGVMLHEVSLLMDEGKPQKINMMGQINLRQAILQAAQEEGIV